MSVKLHEAYCLDSQSTQLLFYDDFLGDSLRDLWTVGGSAGGSAVVVDAQDGGIVRLTTGGTTNDAATLTWNSIDSLLVSKKVTFEMRAKISSVSKIEVYIRILGTASWLMFWFNPDVFATNWRIYTNNGGATAADSGIAADTDYHIFRIEAFPTGEVHYYIDGVETANSPITTTIPTGYMSPTISISTKENAAKSLDIDYVVIRQEI